MCVCVKIFVFIFCLFVISLTNKQKERPCLLAHSILCFYLPPSLSTLPPPSLPLSLRHPISPVHSSQNLPPARRHYSHWC